MTEQSLLFVSEFCFVFVFILGLAASVAVQRSNLDMSGVTLTVWACASAFLNRLVENICIFDTKQFSCFVVFFI